MAKHYFWICLWGCFQKISAFEFVNWVERSPSPMSAGIIQSVECQNEENKKVGKGEFAFLAWAGTPIFFCPWTPELLVLQFSDLDQNYSINFLVLSPLDSDQIIPLASLGLYLAHSRSWDFLTSIVLWNNFYNKSPLMYIYIYHIGSVSLENPK